MQKVTEWFTAGKKAIISCILIIGGIGLSCFGPKMGYIGMLEYYLYLLGTIGLSNILFSKISDRNMNFVLHLSASTAITAVVISLFSNMLDTWTQDTTIMIALIIFALFWILHIYLIQKTAMIKRLVISFFGAFMNILFMGGVFFIIALLRIE